MLNTAVRQRVDVFGRAAGEGRNGALLLCTTLI